MTKPTLGEFFREAQRADWYADMADDPDVRRRGRQEIQELYERAARYGSTYWMVCRLLDCQAFLNRCGDSTLLLRVKNGAK